MSLGLQNLKLGLHLTGITVGLQKKPLGLQNLGTRITKKKASGLQKDYKKKCWDYNPLPSVDWAYLQSCPTQTQPLCGYTTTMYPTVKQLSRPRVYQGRPPPPPPLHNTINHCVSRRNHCVGQFLCKNLLESNFQGPHVYQGFPPIEQHT